MVDLDAYRDESREIWSAMAPGWEARREWLMGVTGPVSDWIVGRADPQPGQTVLEAERMELDARTTARMPPPPPAGA